MNTGTLIALGAVALVLVGGLIFYQQQRAAAEAAAFARTPGAQIGGGIGGIVSGAINLATGSSGS